MVDVQLRQQLERTLQHWRSAVPNPFGVEEFCVNLGKLRSRPIMLIPWNNGHEDLPTGLWIATSNADYIFFDSLATGLHRVHIILHELGHLLLGHLDGHLDGVDFLTGPAADPQPIRAVLGRTRAYDEHDEHAAEQFATYVAEWTSRQRPDVVGALDRAAAHHLVIDRVSAAFAGDRPWRR